MESRLNPREQLGQRGFQTLGNLFDIDQRNISNSALDSAVVGPMQSTPFGGFLLINLLRFAHAPDSAAKSDADVQGHSLPSWRRTADPYTAYESHLGYNTFVPEYYRFLTLLAERVHTARLSTGPIRDASDFHAWLVELSEIAERSASLEELLKQI